MDAEQVLAFRLARSGLAAATRAGSPRRPRARRRTSPATRRCSRSRARRATRHPRGYDEAVDAGDLVVAHIVRGAIHALAPGDLALYGRALIATDDDELGAQLGRQVKRLAAEKGFAPTAALDEVAAATKDALAGGRGARQERAARGAARARAART